MQPKISVIVPVYNTEKYLRRCIDSIINQTYTNLEIILIDDGSTDGSEKIVDEYAKKDSRIIVIHKDNAGVGSARNVGLRMFTGDYLAFIDSDDWIEEDMYSAMVEKAEDREADVVICNFFKDFGEKSIIMKNMGTIDENVFHRDELLKYVFLRDSYRGIGAYPVNKLLKRRVVIAEEFNEKYKIGEDVLWFVEITKNINKCIYIQQALYHYVQHDNSAVHTVNLQRQCDRLLAYKDVIKILEYRNSEKETITYVKRFLAYHAMNITKMAYEQNNAVILEFAKNIMKKNKAEYITTNKEYQERIDEFSNVLNLTL